MSSPRLAIGRSVLLLAPLTLLLAGAAPPTEAPVDPNREAPRFYHIFDGQRVALELDTSRFAVLAGDDASHLLEFESELPIPGWRLVETPEGVRSIESAVAATHAATDREDLEFVSPVFIGADGGPVVVTPTLLIRIDPAIAPEVAERMIRARVEGEIIERDWANMPGAYRVSAAARSGFVVLNAANALAETPGVLWAEPDMIFTGRGGLLPNDPFFPNCWGLHNTGQSGGLVDFDMDCPEAWDLTTGDPSVIVLVLDTGVDPTHPDINQITGEDFTTDPDLNGAPVSACDRHGTPVAGCVSAIINNATGVVGAAPGCTTASARAFISDTSACDGSWTSQSSWTVNALTWGESIGARVSNNSNGYGFTSSAIANKYSSSRSAGMVHFASAGNESSTSISYPSSLSTVNSIIALNRFGNRASFSNWGTGVAFSAPGETIYSTDRQGSAGYVSGDIVVVNGTSFAAPYAAGVAALLLSIDDTLSAAEVEQAMQLGATDLGSPGYDISFGWGLVNARATIDRGPGAFEITSPECDGAIAGRTVEWSAAFFGDSYTVEIATDAAFTTIVYTQPGLTGGSHTIPSGALTPCEPHYVRVTAFNAFGQTVADAQPCPFTLAFESDINNDGDVDTSDLGGLVGAFGSAGPFGDINGDGVVDTADLGLVILDFGGSCAP